MRLGLAAILASVLMIPSAYAVQVHDIILKDSDTEMPSVKWSHDGDIHIFNFKLGLRKVDKHEDLFKMNCMHSGLWIKQLDGDFGSKDVKARYIQIQNRNGASYAARRPSIDANAADGTPDKVLSDANAAYDAGNFEEALKRYIAYYTKLPEDRCSPYAMFMAGQCLCALLKDDEAMAMHKALMQKYPTSKLAADALYRIACVTIGIKDKKDEGKTLLGEVVKRYPGTEAAEDALFALAGMELAADKPKDAAVIWAAYLKQYPNGYFAESVKRNLAQLTSVAAQQ